MLFYRKLSLQPVVESTLILILLCVGCGGDEGAVDANGDFIIALTSGANGCEFENWQEGATSTGIPLSIVDQGAGVTATMGGAAVLFLDLLQGSHVFGGDLDGHTILLELTGTKQLDRNGCTHLVNSTLEAELDGDVLVGTVVYTTSPECPNLAGCESVQTFNGTR